MSGAQGATWVLSPRASADLHDIWASSTARWGDSRTEKYIREIWAAVETLAADPRRGRPCDDIRAGYAKYSVGAHVIFFRRTTGGIDIVRILHSRMDFGRHV